MVIDETGIMDAFSKAFNVLKADLKDIIIVLIISIIGSVVIGYVPFVSTLFSSVFNVIIGLAFIDIYMNYKNKWSELAFYRTYCAYKSHFFYVIAKQSSTQRCLA